MRVAGSDAEPALVYGTGPARWVLAATVLGSGMTGLDSTVVNIALPAIGRTFHAGVDTLQWTVDGYLLSLSALLLLGGSLADRFGRRRVFSVGVVWFAAASAMCGLAPDGWFLIGSRILQGIGGAMLAPASLAILESTFRTQDRATAVGAWSGLSGLATAAGPLLGGYLVQAASWRWVFFINVPVAAAVLLAARHVPETRGEAGRTDVWGTAAAVLLLGGVTIGLTEGPELGWTSPAVLAAVVVGVLAAPALLLVVGRGRDPMLPLSLFRRRQFSAANGVTFAVYAALGGALFLLPIELQVVVRYGALDAGLSLLPITAIMLAFSPGSGRLATRIGPRPQMSVGPIVIGAGLLMMIRIGPQSGYLAVVLPAVVVLACGLAITVAPLTAVALGAAPPERSGTASAVNNVVARAAGLMAVAVLPAAAGISSAAQLSAARFASGFRVACVIAACVSMAGGVVAALALERRGRREEGVRPARHWTCAVDGTPLEAPVAARGARGR